MSPRDVKAGVYRHYRGEYYLVLGLAHHSETMETFVVYVPLYVREGPRMAVRPVEMFFGAVEEMCRECGCLSGVRQENGSWWCGICDKYYIPSEPRFTYIGAEMPDREAK